MSKSDNEAKWEQNGYKTLQAPKVGIPAFVTKELEVIIVLLPFSTFGLLPLLLPNVSDIAFEFKLYYTFGHSDATQVAQ